MKRKHCTALFIMPILFLVACKEKKASKFYIETNNGYGLINNSSVIRKGVTIGFVEDVSIVGNKVIITLVLNSMHSIPENSEIYVGAKDICTKALYIEYVHETGKKIQEGDTIKREL